MLHPTLLKVVLVSTHLTLLLCLPAKGTKFHLLTAYKYDEFTDKDDALEANAFTARIEQARKDRKDFENQANNLISTFQEKDEDTARDKYQTLLTLKDRINASSLNSPAVSNVEYIIDEIGIKFKEHAHPNDRLYYKDRTDQDTQQSEKSPTAGAYIWTFPDALKKIIETI